MDEPTIRDVLELPAFRRTQATVFAADDELARPVRWVHYGEIPDIARFLSGGEMLLTAGLGLGLTEADQRGYIRAIAGAHAAVLVVELAGRAFTTMPASAVDEARRHRFPLIGLRDEIPFVEVSAQVHEMLVEARVRELTAEEAINQAFIDLLLSGQDYLAVTEELARRLEQPVVLENITHQILAYVGRTAEADAVTAAWESHSRALHELHTGTPRTLQTGTRPVNIDQQSSGCARRPVILRGESWGWVHVLHEGNDLTSAESYALDRAAATIAITLLSERASGARTAQRHGALINRLMVGDLAGKEFVARARTLGHDFRNHPVVVAITSSGLAAERADLSAIFGALRLPAITADLGDYSVGIVGHPRASTLTHITEALSRHGMPAGLSRAVAAENLPVALRQARNAASVAASRVSTAVLCFDDLGLLRLLAPLADGPELARYVEDELAAVLHHDATSANPLLPTLRAYLDCDGNKSHAADLLFVQRRTLYYRLDRLAALLGASLDDPEIRQRLLLAVRGYDLLHRHPSP